jgi:hypothetical protein
MSGLPAAVGTLSFIHQATNEISCFLVMHMHNIVQSIGAPLTDIYNLIVPDVNYVLSW